MNKPEDLSTPKDGLDIPKTNEGNITYISNFPLAH
jgi:hypothetical protein